MKSFHDSLSTPSSEPRPLVSPDPQVMQVQEEKSVIDQETRRGNKASKSFRGFLKKDLNIKVSEETMHGWINNWSDEKSSDQPNEFSCFFGTKLANELVQNRDTKPHRKALEFIIGKKYGIKHHAFFKSVFNNCIMID